MVKLTHFFYIQSLFNSIDNLSKLTTPLSISLDQANTLSCVPTSTILFSSCHSATNNQIPEKSLATTITGRELTRISHLLLSSTHTMMIHYTTNRFDNMDGQTHPDITIDELNTLDAYDTQELNDGSSSGFLNNRLMSISTTSIKSLLPNLYSIKGTQIQSTPALGRTRGNTSSFGSDSPSSVRDFSPDPTAFVSDELARDSDVIVSTNVTPQAEYKGFASYVISCIFLTTWLCWSLLPDRVLNMLGIYYYPSRWWALAIPSYILVSMVYGYVALACYNVEYLTLPLNDPRNFVDDSGLIVSELENFNKDSIDNYLYKGTSGVWDLPTSLVNDVLYGSFFKTKQERSVKK